MFVTLTWKSVFVCVLISGSSAGQRHPRQRARRPGGGQNGWGRSGETISSGDGDHEQLSWGENLQTYRWASGWNLWSGANGETLTLLVSCTITEMLRSVNCTSSNSLCGCLQCVGCWWSNEGNRGCHSSAGPGPAWSWGELGQQWCGQLSGQEWQKVVSL